MSQPQDPNDAAKPAHVQVAPGRSSEKPALDCESCAPRKITRVLAAIDLGEESDRIIRAALRFAGEQPEEIVLLHVVCDLEWLLGPYVCRKPLTELQSDLAIDGKSQLQRLVRECGQDTSAVREVVLSGVPWSEIVAAARRHRSDIIVIGAHTDERPSHRLLGSTVTRVMREAPCPVVVIPPSLTRPPISG